MSGGVNARLARAISEKSYEDAARLYMDLKAEGVAGMDLVLVLAAVEMLYVRAKAPSERNAYGQFLDNECRLCGVSRRDLGWLGSGMVRGFEVAQGRKDGAK